MKGTIKKTLKNIGLSEKESEIYIFLGKRGPLKGSEISRQLKVNKGQVYRILKGLQKKGLIEATLEYPARFTSVPFEKVIDSFIMSKREEVDQIEESKDDLLSDWKKISSTELESSLERFSVIEGEKKIFQKISQMINETKKQFVSISSVYGLIRADNYGIFENILNNPSGSKIKFRFLTQLTKDDIKPIKNILSKMKSGPDFKGRDPERSSSIFPRMVIKDNNEILLFISDENDSSATRRIEAVLCTNCKSIVKSFASVFEDLWNKSSDLEKRIVELETGNTSPAMELIKDPKIAKKKYYDALNQARKEILIVTSPKRLNEISKNVEMVRKWCNNGVSTKIMAPITTENLKATQELLSCSEVRHISVGYRETTIIDGKRLFQFNKPCASNVDDCEMLNLENVFFTNDQNFINQTKKSLFEIWTKTHTPPTKDFELMLQDGLLKDSNTVLHHSVLEKRGFIIELEHHQIGVLSKKDVLNKIKKERDIVLQEDGKNPKTRRRFGQRAFGLIQPPKNLHLPKMIIGVFHDDELSETKGQKYMIIDIPQKSTSDITYIPVAYIQNSSKSLEIRKKALAGFPIENNIQVLKEDKFQVQVMGKTMFVGWTVPITLTSKYVLPPACILFEGFGEVKSGKLTCDILTNQKYEIWYNSLDAFISFFLPDYKYVGSGTEGFIDIDSVWIIKT